MKRLLLHLLSLITSVLIGWFLVEFLTVHPLKMTRYLTFTLLCLALLILWIYALKKKRYRWVSVLVSLIGFFGGYTINTHNFLNREDSRFVPELTRESGDLGKGHTAVVYFTHGEPETYDPIGWINQFREFDDQGIKFVPFVARPFFAYVLRNKYLEAGKSNHRQVHQEMLHSLEKTYRLEGDSSTRFYLCFLDDEPRPDAAVIQALNDGADTILVADVFLTISNHTAEGQNLIQELEVEEKLGIPVIYTEPMWSSEKLRSVFLEKVYEQMGNTPKEEVAVAFVGHGQPDEWDVEWPTETEQEMAFREEIIKLFVADGFKPENLGSAWMEFKEPKPASLMQNFVENGATKIFYFSTAISADAMHSQIDVPRLVEEYDFPDGVETMNLGAWNNHPTVIAAIRERIDETLDSF